MFGKPGSDANKHLLRLRSRRLRALRPRALWLSLKCDQYHVVTILSNSGAAKAAWFSALPETTTCVIGSPMAPCSVKSVGGMSEKLLRSGWLKVPRTVLLAIVCCHAPLRNYDAPTAGRVGRRGDGGIRKLADRRAKIATTR